MKFIYKIICCPGHSQILSELAKYGKVNADFNCSCDLEHSVFVLKCEQHPFVHDLKIFSECICKELPGPKICRSCVEKRLILNNNAKKYCFRQLPSYIDNNVVCFEQDLKADLFFCYENNMVFCYLDNYNYKEIIDNFNFSPGN